MRTLLVATALMLAVPATATAVAVVSDGLPVKTPTAVGMSAARLETIDRVVKRGISAGGYPGAAVVVGRKGAAVWEKGYGTLGWDGASARVAAERTIYDLASLSKVVGTTTAIMVLYDEGRIGLDDPVVKYVPGFAGGYKDSVTIRHLLTHRSGLPAGRDLWRVARNPAEARQMVIDTPLECKPGQCYIYSDLGADMLGIVAETVAGQTLDQLLAEKVFQPLGMTDTYYRPADSLRYRIAPTEVTPPRGYPLRGEVHDENAYALGGVAGHAGLFSTAADLSVFAQMMLNGGEYNGVRVIADSTVQLFTRRAAGSRALGWDTCNGDGGCGENMSERAYGHTGFTGTSIWIDPDREMFVILLTNRVHAARARRPAKVIADVRADLADAASAAVMDDPDNILAMPVSFRADRAEGWNPTVRHVHGRSAKSRRGRAAAAARKRSSGKAAKSARAGRGASVSKGKKSAVTKSSASGKRSKGAARSGSSKKKR
ncbi:MAG: serine hydrolase domain-containing protein [Gemmatimonadaceae bacterium]